MRQQPPSSGAQKELTLMSGQPKVPYALKRATIEDANDLAAFERSVADPKLYGPSLDLAGAIE
jgi:hypothetical protein